MAEGRQGRQAPNWLKGIQDWALTHKPQAGLLVVGIVVFGFIFLRGGDEEPVRQTMEEQREEEVFDIGEGLTGEITTASALVELQSLIEGLQLTMDDQARQHGLLRREVGGLTGELREAKETLGAEVLSAVQFEFEKRLSEMVDEELGGTLDRVLAVVREERERAVVPVSEEVVLPLQVLRPDAREQLGGEAAEGAEGDAAAAAVRTPPPADSQRTNWVRLPVGSIASGRIVTGMFATTASGDALPALIKFDTGFVGPNGSRIPLKGCLVVGAAAADLASVRARIQARRMACMFPDGKVFEANISGMVTGADGILGVPGRMHERKGRWLANVLSSMGIATAALYGDYAIARSLGASGGTFFGDLPSVSENMAQPLQQFFLERANDIVPVVWIEANTPVHIVMLDGITLEGMSPLLAQAAGFGESFQ